MKLMTFQLQNLKTIRFKCHKNKAMLTIERCNNYYITLNVKMKKKTAVPSLIIYFIYFSFVIKKILSGTIKGMRF